MAVQEERNISVDVLSVVLMTMAKLPDIYALRDLLRSTSDDFDAAGIEALGDVTRALLRASGAKRPAEENVRLTECRTSGWVSELVESYKSRRQTSRGAPETQRTARIQEVTPLAQ